MRKFLLLVCLALPLGADSQKLYRGTLGPTQTVTLALGDDHSATLSFIEDKKVSRATGHYTWAKDQLTMKVEQAEPFVLEVRRKGVEPPAPKMEVRSGQELHWKTELKGDALTLSGPPGWDLPLFLQH